MRHLKSLLLAGVVCLSATQVEGQSKKRF
ncbi:MAG: hypothetical protein RLZZ252_158, partial [Bacteroidota bacterium]